MRMHIQGPSQTTPRRYARARTLLLAGDDQHLAWPTATSHRIAAHWLIGAVVQPGDCLVVAAPAGARAVTLEPALMEYLANEGGHTVLSTTPVVNADAVADLGLLLAAPEANGPIAGAPSMCQVSDQVPLLWYGAVIVPGWMVDLPRAPDCTYPAADAGPDQTGNGIVHQLRPVQSARP